MRSRFIIITAAAALAIGWCLYRWGPYSDAPPAGGTLPHLPSARPDLNGNPLANEPADSNQAGPGDYEPERMQAQFKVLINAIESGDGASIMAKLQAAGLPLEVRRDEEVDSSIVELQLTRKTKGVLGFRALIGERADGTKELLRFEMVLSPDRELYAEALAQFSAAFGEPSRDLGSESTYLSWGIGTHQVWIDEHAPEPGQPVFPVGSTIVSYEPADEEESSPPEPPSPPEEDSPTP